MSGKKGAEENDARVLFDIGAGVDTGAGVYGIGAAAGAAGDSRRGAVCGAGVVLVWKKEKAKSGDKIIWPR